MGQTGDQNFALCPAFGKRKSPWGKDPYVKTLSFPLRCGDTRKVIAPHFSPAVPPPFPIGGGGGQWLQMTGALVLVKGKPSLRLILVIVS